MTLSYMEEITLSNAVNNMIIIHVECDCDISMHWIAYRFIYVALPLPYPLQYS